MNDAKPCPCRRESPCPEQQAEQAGAEESRRQARRAEPPPNKPLLNRPGRVAARADGRDAARLRHRCAGSALQ